jgi:hypothetical protein
VPPQIVYRDVLAVRRILVGVDPVYNALRAVNGRAVSLPVSRFAKFAV